MKSLIIFTKVFIFYMKGFYPLTELYVYPIKSLGGISLQEAMVTDRGLQYDRRWMLVDEQGRFLSQRERPTMALFQVFIQNDTLQVVHKHFPTQKILIPLESQITAKQVMVWNDICQALTVSADADEFFSTHLGQKAQLVYMPENSHRKVETRYASRGEITSFSDGYPFLLIGQSSLDDLNSRLESAVPMNRFRPNLVFSGGEPFEEDHWQQFQIQNITFTCAKPCARCVVTTIDQETAIQGKEPLRTLSSYRKQNNKILFGQNILHQGSGKIALGDIITVISKVSSNI
jgi:uncharacterized protein YcbX